MVATCSGCNVFASWASFIAGFLGGVAYVVWHYGMLKLKFDASGCIKTSLLLDVP